MPRTLTRRLPLLAAIVALPLAGCALVAPQAHVHAEMVVDVENPDGSAAEGEVLDAAARAIGARLAEARIPALGARPEDGHVVVRFGDETTDADLEAAAAVAGFSSSAEFRPVLLSGIPTGIPATGTESDVPLAPPTDASDLAWVTPALQAAFEAEDCTNDREDLADPDLPVIACQEDRSVVYALGPAEVGGSRIADAVAMRTRAGDWGVYPTFDADGTTIFAQVTQRLVTLEPPRNQFAIVVDGVVLSAPAVAGAITNGAPEITGSFDQESAEALAATFRLASLGIRTQVRSTSVLDD